ncbi:MAG: 50S ribosomal protein L35ae [Candidatus Hadarchaeaceae archaeon]
MRAVIINFRGGFRTRRGDEVIIRPSEKLGGSLIGRKVTWRNPRAESKVIGKIVAFHGRACYRARFRSGLPGWAVGSAVEIS